MLTMAGSRTIGAGEEVGDVLDRLLRCRQADAGGAIRQQVEPLERKREVRAALVVGDGVDFVDDDRLDVAAGSRGCCSAVSRM